MDLIRSIIENTRTNRTYLYQYKIERLRSRYEDYIQLWCGITKTEYPDPSLQVEIFGRGSAVNLDL